MPYVNRVVGVVTGIFQVAQPDYAEEWLDESADDIVTFIERWRGPLAPEPVIPDRVFRRQFFMMLDKMDASTNPGIYDQVNGWVASQPRAIRIVYENAGSFVRTDEMLQQGFVALGFTSELIDASKTYSSNFPDRV